ncbi:hypothetical protein KR222_003593, partial [Zaprionus bogoriensis]
QQDQHVVHLIESAIRAALEHQAKEFDAKLNAITKQMREMQSTVPEVQTYEKIRIEGNVECNEPLDIVKSIPEFDGKQENYVSWRQAATAAYEVFSPYDGSSRHYQAVAIIRNKIRGPLMIQQELNLMRQGDKTLLEYYDEVERKLTLLVNKTIMTHDQAAATVLNDKFRSDALATF